MFNMVPPLFINKYNTNRAIWLRFQTRKQNKDPRDDIFFLAKFHSYSYLVTHICLALNWL